MKTIGMLGGMSWESTIEYYRIVNECVKKRLGGLHSAELVMYSVEFAAIESLMRRNAWQEAAALLTQAARNVERAGADFLIICTNTIHKLAPDIQRQIHIPLLHIADATANVVKTQGIRSVALLGTRFTMTEGFFKDRLARQYALRVIVPGKNEMDRIHAIIFAELCLGRIEPASRETFLEIIARLVSAGAEGVILGCTEIGLLLKPQHVSIPLFDTTRIHAEAAVDFALEDHAPSR